MPNSCIHHFILESPNGPSVKGKCKKCGEEKLFSTSIEEAGWPSSTVKKKKTTLKKDVREADL